MKYKIFILIMVTLLITGLRSSQGLGNSNVRSLGGHWQAMSTQDAPVGRYGHTMVWSGNEMLVWGGYSGSYLDTGGAYDPGIDQWTLLSTDNAPSGRLRHTAIWTGEKMIVWGGEAGGGSSTTNTGGIYDPDTDTWAETSLENAPSPREQHSAIWTGEVMIVWGGCSTVGCGQKHNDGGIYDPVLDEWTPLAEEGEPRNFHQALWSGDEMILWGGTSDPHGAAYDPVADTWTSLSSVNAPTPTFQGAGVWSGEEMIVWGGCTVFSTSPCPTYVGDGGRYNPTTDTWQPLSTNNSPASRWTHTAVWSGQRMITWGGCGAQCYDNGGMYHPILNSWEETTTINAPLPRSNHEAVWTSEHMLIWGGCDVGGCATSNYFNTGGIYTPSVLNFFNVYLPVMNTGDH